MELEHHHRHRIAKSESYKQRLGFLMCGLYALAYSGFVFISVWNVEYMDKLMPFGLNLAVFYGMGLIVFALVLAFVYSQLCRTSERKASHVPVEKSNKGENV